MEFILFFFVFFHFLHCLCISIQNTAKASRDPKAELAWQQNREKVLRACTVAQRPPAVS